MSRVYFDEALEILKYLRGRPDGTTVAAMMEVFPSYYRSKLSRYLAELERRGLVYRIKQPMRGKGRMPDIWFIKRGGTP